jgi:phospholipase C
MWFDTPNQLPVMHQLANEFAVCDNWFSSLPGPTWPNRFFAYAATSGEYDDSPSSAEMGKWESGVWSGMKFANGSIIDLLRNNNYGYRLYQDQLSRLSFPIVLALDGVSYNNDMHDIGEFESDLHNGYPYPLTIIEPNYGDFAGGTYAGGSSQHPMDGMARGEALIKGVYEAIRNSPIWEQSLLIITYDEHGGFYDHVAPPKATPPSPNAKGSKHKFKFDQYGVRVPAVVVSPWIPKHTVSHTLCDHTSMLKTIEEILALRPLTDRDAAANSLKPLLANQIRPSSDCPRTLHAVNYTVDAPRVPLSAEEEAVLYETPLPESGNIYGFLAIAMKVDRELSEGIADGAPLLKSASEIKTVGQARDYINSVLEKAQKEAKE